MIIFYIIILILCYWYFLKYEHFKIVAYNNDFVSNNSNTNDNLNSIRNIFNNLNLKNKNFKESKLDPSYKLFNINLTFVFTSIFKSIIINYLYSNIPNYKTENVYILGDLNNIYEKDQNNSRIFIFNVTLVNPVNFFTCNIMIRLKLNNIKSILDNKLNYIDFNDDFIFTNTSLESITLDMNNYTIDPIDNKLPYYTIKNKFHLMDNQPLVSKEDKVKFQYVLHNRKK